MGRSRNPPESKVTWSHARASLLTLGLETNGLQTASLPIQHALSRAPCDVLGQRRLHHVDRPRLERELQTHPHPCWSERRSVPNPHLAPQLLTPLGFRTSWTMLFLHFTMLSPENKQGNSFRRSCLGFRVRSWFRFTDVDPFLGLPYLGLLGSRP